jgi:hypothetical protein
MPKPNLDCFARALGDCQGPMSGEHYISEAILKFVGGPSTGNPGVYGHNLAGLPRGQRRWRDIGQLKRKILCKKHNSDLSDYDRAGLAMCKAGKSMYQADNTGDQTAEIFTIDGDDLERWMLKTLIGGYYSGKVWEELADMEGVDPPLEWLDILYGRKDFPFGHGLYWQPTELEGVALDGRDEFELMPRIYNQKLIGLRAWFFSPQIALLMENFQAGTVPGHYRPVGLRVDGCYKRIVFAWKNGSEDPEIPVGRRQT